MADVSLRRGHREADDLLALQPGDQPADLVLRNGKIVTNGGRVLNVTARGSTPSQARARAYAVVDMIEFDGKQLRRDIAARAVERLAAV